MTKKEFYLKACMELAKSRGKSFGASPIEEMDEVCAEAMNLTAAASRLWKSQHNGSDCFDVEICGTVRITDTQRRIER